ncbi:MAG: 16S rRNA (cytidine(1402)-2'-O)-methyltransferase [Dehalococcoidia bacterium]
MPKLFVVATPIGNLQDISARALQVLGDVNVIAAEDTRTAKVLLNHYGIKTRLLSYNGHNHARRFPDILAYLENGEDVALVSDAGTPAISDPGVPLVEAAREAGHEVVAVPGPSAVIAALSIAGLPTTSFTFTGFLPRTEGRLRALLESAGEATLVAFESPERLAKSLATIADTLPDRRLAVCRELTKRFEEVFVGTAAEALEHFTEVRGEIVIVIEGSQEEAPTDLDAAAAEALQMRELGLSRQQATALLTSRFGIGRREAYDLWLQSEK